MIGNSFSEILNDAPFFLLVYARCFSLVMTLPLFSMRTVSRIAKLALSFYMAFIIYTNNYTDFLQYTKILGDDGSGTLKFVFLLAGESLIGVIMGFYIQIIFAAFSTAGQFTAFQMGFSASEVYDALSQVENPLMGQFFNLCAMLVFMQTQWFQKLFLGGLTSSFKSMNAISLVENFDTVVKFLTGSLTKLFADALVIALPVMGTLLLITICTGFLSKAAPQMNLLSEGFPIMILVAFFVIATCFPSLVDFFVRSFNKGFSDLEKLFYAISKGIQ